MDQINTLILDTFKVLISELNLKTFSLLLLSFTKGLLRYSKEVLRALTKT